MLLYELLALFVCLGPVKSQKAFIPSGLRLWAGAAWLQALGIERIHFRVGSVEGCVQWCIYSLGRHDWWMQESVAE